MEIYLHSTFLMKESMNLYVILIKNNKKKHFLVNGLRRYLPHLSYKTSVSVCKSFIFQIGANIWYAPVSWKFNCANNLILV